MHTEHFSENECKCKCCDFNNTRPELLILMERIRKILGDNKIFVHCVSRCNKHNKEVGGVKNSQHLFGKAIDFHVENLSHQKAYEILLKAFSDNLIPEMSALFIYDWGLHLDIRNKNNNILITRSYEVKNARK